MNKAKESKRAIESKDKRNFDTNSARQTHSCWSAEDVLNLRVRVVSNLKGKIEKFRTLEPI